MVTVTECIPLGKGRIRYHMDDGTEFVLYRGEAKKYRLGEGAELSDNEYEELLYGVVGKRAKKRALHLLEKMDRTERQLRDKLRQGGYPPVCVDLALEYVISYHYVDDYRYACNFIRCSQERMSRQQMKQKLMGKGVDREKIEQALEENYETDENDQIIKLLEKRNFVPGKSDQKEFQRTYQYLMRRGFHSSDVLRAMKAV